MPIKLPPRRPTLARNSHLPDVARRTLDAVSPIIQQHNHNALQVASYPVFIYQRLQAGAPCTCSLAVPTHQAAPLYDEEGHASVAVIDSIVNQARFGIEDYNPMTPSSSQPGEVAYAASTDIASGNPVIEGEDEYDMTTESSLNAYSAGACPICFGTGFVGGYSFLHGMRWVLDASALDECDGIDVDRSTGPYTIRLLHDDAYVRFRVLASAPPLCPKVHVYDNFSAVPFVTGPSRLRAVHDDPSVAAYDLGPSPFAAPGWVTLELRAADLQVRDFTHVEITLPLNSKPLNVDFPNLQTAFDATRIQQIPSTTITLPPTAPPLKPRDVVCDMKSGVLWLVTGARTVHPAAGQIWTQEADVRPLEPHEPEAALPSPEIGWLAYYLPPGVYPGQQPITRRGGY